MANMRLRCIHSTLLLGVVALLLFYSAFLTSPSYEENSNSVDGTGNPNLFLQAIRAASSNLSSSSSFIVLSLTDNTVPQQQLQAENFNPSQPLTVSSPNVSPSDFELYDTVSASSGVSSGIKRDLSKQEVGETPKQNDLVNPTNEQAEQFNKAQAALINTNSINSNINKLTTKAVVTPVKKSYSNNKNVVWTKEIYEPGFSYPNPQICPNEGQDVRILILITSAPGHFSARDAIRLTWGHYAQRLDVSMAFFLGKAENETILDGIEIEKRIYDDIIVGNTMDSYDNLTLKTMSAMEWIDTYCNQSSYTIKTDDDMFINVPNLLSFIDKIEDEDRKEPKIYGRLARKWKPVRNKKSKYYISFQQFRKTVYPDFTTGPAYLFSSTLSHSLFLKGMEKTYLKLEDVYTTGIVAQELKIKRMNIGDFANKKVNFHKTGFCALTKLISMHMVQRHEQFELWKKILDGRTKCKVIYTSAKNKLVNNSGSPSSSNNNNKTSSSTAKTMNKNLQK